MALELPEVFDDPLGAMPSVLSNGPRLPGSSQVIDCSSEPDWSQPLSLLDAIDIALCRNPQIRSAWADIKLQASAVGQARAAYLPTLSGSVSGMTNKTHYPDFSESDTTNRGRTAYLSLTWRLFDFGGRASARESANLSLTAALLSHDYALQKTLAATVNAYFEVQTAQAQLQSRREATQIAMRTLLAAQHREKRGVAAQNDTLQANTALAKAQLTEQRAQGDYEKTSAVLVYAMGSPPSQPIQLAAISAPHLKVMQEELHHWILEAQAHNPGILAAQAQVDAARAKIQAVRSEGLPTIDFTGNYYVNGFPNEGLQSTKSNTTTFGLTLNIPFFEGFGRTYKIRSAQAQAEQSEAQLADIERQISSEVMKAHADAVAALSNLDSSSKLLEAAQAALSSSERRYDKGVAEIIEILNQQSALAEARQERIRCLSEWQSARLRLMADTGILGRKELIESLNLAK